MRKRNCQCFKKSLLRRLFRISLELKDLRICKNLRKCHAFSKIEKYVSVENDSVGRQVTELDSKTFTQIAGIDVIDYRKDI